jgi:Mg2+ and Co2+ transporter CorA
VLVGLQTVEAKQQERIWRSRAATAEATLQQMQQDMAEIVADMKRQHEAALQATQQRMQQLEAREAELLRLMEGKEAAVKELAAKHSDTCKDRDAQASNPPPAHAHLTPEIMRHFSIAATAYRPGAVMRRALPAWVYTRVDSGPVSACL